MNAAATMAARCRSHLLGHGWLCCHHNNIIAAICGRLPGLRNLTSSALLTRPSQPPPTKGGDVAEAKRFLSSIKRIKAQDIAEKKIKLEDQSEEDDSYAANKKKLKIFQCKGCGHQTKSWKAFLSHMNDCKDCTTDMIAHASPGTQVVRAERTVYSDKLQIYHRRIGVQKQMNIAKNDRNRRKKELRQRLSHLDPKQRNAKIKDMKRYECKMCGDQVKHWSQFLDHMRDCAHCGKKEARRLGKADRRAIYELYVEDDDGEVVGGEQGIDEEGAIGTG